MNNTQQDLKFDRILCDVPCSGDATMRKNLNVWKDFRVGNALGLHSVQELILNRGLQLLKKGGRLVYSTCSLSPIENEAIVASALRKWGNQIKLVNVDNELPGLKRRKGVSDWKVYGKDMELREPGAEDVPATAFPPTKEEAENFHLENCVRVYPHLQTLVVSLLLFMRKLTLSLVQNRREKQKIAILKITNQKNLRIKTMLKTPMLATRVDYLEMPMKSHLYFWIRKIQN